MTTYQSVADVENEEGGMAVRCVPLWMCRGEKPEVGNLERKKSVQREEKMYPGASKAHISGCRTPIAPGKKEHYAGNWWTQKQA